jgi:lipid-binding SYLF domain-containing protein
MVTAVRLALIVPVLLLGTSSDAFARRNKDKDEIAGLVQQVKKDWQAKDNTFNKTLKETYAYALFPEVGKGGFIVGASHGAGEVHQKRRLIGHAKMTQTTVGAQVGGQTYAQVILFEDKAGVAIMVLPKKGAMAETAGGGQKFAFEPLGE